MNGSTSQKRLSDPVQQYSPKVEQARLRSSNKKNYHSSQEKVPIMDGNQVIDTPFIKMHSIMTSRQSIANDLTSKPKKKTSVTPIRK